MTTPSIVTSREIENKLRERAAEGGLLTLRMDIINKCNLQCVMCHYSDPSISRRKSVYISAEQFESWFSSVGGFVKEIMLSCGDEPLMSKHFVEIIAQAGKYSASMDVGLCTNAMLMKDRVRKALLTHGVTFILFSIDGAVKETVERIRVKSRFEQIVANIKALRELKVATGNSYPRFVLDFVMLKSNMHETVAFIEMAQDLGAELVDFRHAVPSVYWDDQDEKLENFPALFNYYRARVIEKAVSLNLPVTIPDPYPGVEAKVEEDLSDKIDLAPYYAIKPDLTTEPLPNPKLFEAEFHPQTPLALRNEFFADVYCERPFTEVMIRDQREVLPCPWHQKVLGELDNENSIEDIFFGNDFAALRTKMFSGEIDEGCRSCPVKSGFLPTRIPDE